METAGVGIYETKQASVGTRAYDSGLVYTYLTKCLGVADQDIIVCAKG